MIKLESWLEIIDFKIPKLKIAKTPSKQLFVLAAFNALLKNNPGRYNTVMFSVLSFRNLSGLMEMGELILPIQLVFYIDH